ncbi:TIGR03826 family flagellar region protein [Bacillus xiapuensis]|uniref:TIGR03826 family flagellar region protein n=1 Tax=Bacillus xiapuensis TaxID=2014075 RepID=UPI000C2464C7|nr:TIGR03826 family flagellar region protein [Bacillus xiapuensis]
MNEITNCPRCGELYMSNAFRDVCAKCAKEEEQMYEKVYKFLRQRENRAATIERVVEATGVEEKLLYKWMKKGRLHAAQFPNMGYPCDRCGTLITRGTICAKCREEIKEDIKRAEKNEEFEKAKRENERITTYYAMNQDTSKE